MTWARAGTAGGMNLTSCECGCSQVRRPRFLWCTDIGIRIFFWRFPLKPALYRTHCLPKPCGSRVHVPRILPSFELWPRPPLNCIADIPTHAFRCSAFERSSRRVWSLSTGGVALVFHGPKVPPSLQGETAIWSERRSPRCWTKLSPRRKKPAKSVPFCQGNRDSAARRIKKQTCREKRHGIPWKLSRHLRYSVG
jgi:hypothetical protein